MFFAAAKRAEIKDANPEASFGELGKLQGSTWRALSEEDKKEYNEKAAEDKLRFNREMKEYNAKKSSGIGNEPAANTSKQQSNNTTTQRIQPTSNAAYDNTLAPQQNNNRSVVNLGSGNESDMSGPDNVISWKETLVAGTDAPPLSSNLESSVEEEFGGNNDNDPFENFSDSGDGANGQVTLFEKEGEEDLTGLQHLLGGYGTDDSSDEEHPTAVSSLKIAAPQADQQIRSRHIDIVNSPTDVNDTYDFMSTGATSEEGIKSPTKNNVSFSSGSVSTAMEVTKSSEVISNPTEGDEAERRINKIITVHKEKMGKFTTYSVQVLKKLNDQKESIYAADLSELAKVRHSQYTNELQKWREENPSLPMESGEERDQLLQQKNELNSELKGAQQGMADNANNPVVLGMIQNGMKKIEDELEEVNDKLDPLAGKKTSLKRKFEDIYQQDMKKLKIDGNENKAPVQVKNMWSALSLSVD